MKFPQVTRFLTGNASDFFKSLMISLESVEHDYKGRFLGESLHCFGLLVYDVNQLKLATMGTVVASKTTFVSTASAYLTLELVRLYESR